MISEIHLSIPLVNGGLLQRKCQLVILSTEDQFLKVGQLYFGSKENMIVVLIMKSFFQRKMKKI